MFDFSSLFFLCDIPDHLKIKNSLLQEVEKNVVSLDDNITQNYSDYYKKYYNKTYYKLLEPVIQYSHSNMLKELKEDYGIRCVDFWSQIYTKGNNHGWHQHGGCSFASIYYLNLEDNSLSTQFRFRGKTFSIPVKEGQVLTFPGFFMHKSPENTSNTVKVIIAFNSLIDD